MTPIEDLKTAYDNEFTSALEAFSTARHRVRGTGPNRILLPGEAWDHHPAADEYDLYRLYAASRLRRNWSVSDATDYRTWVKGDYMGLGHPDDPSDRSRGAATAEAIKAYLDELPEL